LIDLPGRPSVALAINGDGPLDDFATDIALSTDGTERLEGRITLQGADQGGGRLFDADIKGDIAALFAPQYQDFFGREIALRTKGQQFEDGALTLEDLSLVTNALELNGSVRLNAESWPTFIALDGRIKDRDGSPVLLPLPGDQTKVASVGLKLNFDQSRDEVWTGTFAVDQLARPDLSIDHAGLDISGVLRGDGATPVQITADIDGSLTGLAIADTALMAAVGENISGKLGLSFSEGQSVTLSDLAVKGEGFAVSGDAVIGDLDDGFETTFDLALVASQIERFSALAGRPLSGQADVTMAGTAGLGGAFDLALDGRVTDLTIDVEQADTLLAGQTDLTLKARRSEDGTFVDQLDVRNAALTLTADATLQSEQSDVRFDAALDDIARIVADQSGPVSAKGSARQRGDIWSVDLAATAPYDIETTIKGSVTGPDAEIAYDAIVPDIAPLVPGYSGQAQLRGVLRPEADGWAVETDLNGPYQLDATLAGRVVGANAPDISYKATLPDVSPFVHGIKGGATLDGTLARVEPALTSKLT
jgi:translocation and assembly module TamB